MTQVRSASETFPPTRESAAAARRFVEQTLREHGCPDENIEDALLLTSEIATNAVVHARTDFQIHLRVTPSRIRIEVDDGGMGAAVLTHAGPDEVRGRGLLIVDRLADRWGDEHRAGGRHRVWFELRA